MCRQTIFSLLYFVSHFYRLWGEFLCMCQMANIRLGCATALGMQINTANLFVPLLYHECKTRIPANVLPRLAIVYSNPFEVTKSVTPIVQHNPQTCVCVWPICILIFFLNVLPSTLYEEVVLVYTHKPLLPNGIMYKDTKENGYNVVVVKQQRGRISLWLQALNTCKVLTSYCIRVFRSREVCTSHNWNVRTIGDWYSYSIYHKLNLSCGLVKSVFQYLYSTIWQ